MRPPYTPQEASGSPVGLQTSQDIAQLANVSERTLSRWIEQKKIPYIKVGRTLRFRWAAVEAALVRFERKAVA